MDRTAGLVLALLDRQASLTAHLVRQAGATRRIDGNPAQPGDLPMHQAVQLLAADPTARICANCVSRFHALKPGVATMTVRDGRPARRSSRWAT